MTTQRTPGPWTYEQEVPDKADTTYAIPRWRIMGPDGVEIARAWIGVEPCGAHNRLLGDGNAAFIVRAVNAYDDLLALAEAVVGFGSGQDWFVPELAAQAHAALSAAQGKEIADVRLS